METFWGDHNTFPYPGITWIVYRFYEAERDSRARNACCVLCVFLDVVN